MCSIDFRNWIIAHVKIQLDCDWQVFNKGGLNVSPFYYLLDTLIATICFLRSSQCWVAASGWARIHWECFNDPMCGIVRGDGQPQWCGFCLSACTSAGQCICALVSLGEGFKRLALSFNLVDYRSILSENKIQICLFIDSFRVWSNYSRGCHQ